MDGRLFGRDAELSTVDAFLTEARSGSSALVLEGEPGIGKTTLWKEAAQRAEAGGFTLLTSRPTEAEAPEPEYSALRYNPGIAGHSFRNIFPALSLASTANVAAPVAR